MKREDIVRYLLVTCSARIDTDAGPQGTAFFVAPGFAVTAGHVVGGADALPVRLSEGQHCWRGHVADVRHPFVGEMATTAPHPAPDIALIGIDEGPDAGKSPTKSGKRLSGSGTPPRAWSLIRTIGPPRPTSPCASVGRDGQILLLTSLPLLRKQFCLNRIRITRPFLRLTR
jgi:hypothetical protein